MSLSEAVPDSNQNPDSNQKPESSQKPDSGHNTAEKFAFGRNWKNFLTKLDDSQLAEAEESIKRLIDESDLTGKRFIDAGSGSGLFSLAAWRMGAEVLSFDVDVDSVACTQHLYRTNGEPERWQVTEGSLLDRSFMSQLPKGDIVYCWGVAHHTGEMWMALEHLSGVVAENGKLIVAIYNDQALWSRVWSAIKKTYQRFPRWLRPVLVFLIGSALVLRRLAFTLAASLFRLCTIRNPFIPWANWISESRIRGMNRWYDLVDWVGGWPFEVARPEQIFRWFRDRGFELREMTTCDGHGCNEFVFERVSVTSKEDQATN
ncbi:MAG: 50S ribosomal protein L11 methyltransferase [Planctomycetota bacterium]